MSGEIVNRVANSALITIDLTDYAPKETIAILDAKDFLFEGVILKEKEFRNTLKEFDFSVYTDKIVALYCSSDAIVPMWAFMLLTSYLNNSASKIHFGTKEEVFQKIFSDNIDAIDATEFENKKVIVKGCGQVPLTESLYIAITKKLQNTVSSLMFGEACSAVPVFKKK
jgi:fructose-1-phosphate kinase PfkB-like protein